MSKKSDPKTVLEEGLARLAAMRRACDEQRKKTNGLLAKLEATDLHKEYCEADLALAALEADQMDHAIAIRRTILDVGEELQEKKPAAGAEIVKLTRFEVTNEKEALAYCRESLPGALKLDVRVFKKLMLALPEPARPECVEVRITEFGSVRIASDLDAHYPAPVEANGG